MTAKPVLVVGTTFAFPLVWHGAARRAADMVGRTLARAGFGLVTGNPPGVDSAAARAFWAECQRLGRSPEEAYRQLWLPHFRRGYWMPGEGFEAPPACVVRLGGKEDWIERAMDLAGAAIMIGGRAGGRWRGSLRIAGRFIDAGKPVLPIPFVGGSSRGVFEEILRTWGEAPVPGLTRAQFLRLAAPWLSDTGPLADLLHGTLAETQDVFISYRRDDGAPWAGRIHADLVDHFGARRVFFDLQAIVPAAEWLRAIEGAIASCKVGVVVIGPRFLGRAEGERSSHRPDDVMHQEVKLLLDGGKTILPVLVGGARLPTEEELPAPLKPLRRYQAPSLDNASWAGAMRAMVEAIEGALRPRPPG